MPQPLETELPEVLPNRLPNLNLNLRSPRSDKSSPSPLETEKSVQPLSPSASGSRLPTSSRTDDAVKHRARLCVKRLPTIVVHQPPPSRHARPCLASAGAGPAGSHLVSMRAKSSCRAAADVRLRPRRPSQRAAAAPRPIRLWPPPAIIRRVDRITSTSHPAGLPASRVQIY